MTKEEIIRNLKYEMEKHKNDIVNTFDTNISVMCKDILNYLEQEACEDCISRQKLLEDVDRMMEFGNLFYPTHFKKLVELQSSVIPKQKTGCWIPISEQEPTTASHVLVSTSDGTVCEADYVVIKHDAPMNYLAKEFLDSIVAWMPLPSSLWKK